MPITFAQAWDALSVGDGVKVMDGKAPDGTSSPPPTNQQGLPWKMWKSHNFVGEVVSKNDGEYRSMDIRTCCAVTAPNAVDHAITYTIQEAVLHTFELI